MVLTSYIIYTKSKTGTIATITDEGRGCSKFQRDHHRSAHLKNKYLKVSSKKSSLPPIPAQAVPLRLLQTAIANLLIVLDIDDRLLPLASLNLSLKQNVDFAEGSVLHLWNPNPSHESADKGGGCPDVAALAAQVPLISVEHVAGKEDAGNIDQVVGTSSDTGCQRPETRGRCLADDDPRSRRGSYAEQDGDDQTK